MKPKPSAVIAADWVTSPVACKLMSAAVAVKAELMDRSPPKVLLGLLFGLH